MYKSRPLTLAAAALLWVGASRPSRAEEPGDADAMLNKVFAVFPPEAMKACMDQFDSKYSPYKSNHRGIIEGLAETVGQVTCVRNAVEAAPEDDHSILVHQWPRTKTEGFGCIFRLAGNEPGLTADASSIKITVLTSDVRPSRGGYPDKWGELVYYSHPTANTHSENALNRITPGYTTESGNEIPSSFYSNNLPDPYAGNVTYHSQDFADNRPNPEESPLYTQGSGKLNLRSEHLPAPIPHPTVEQFNRGLEILEAARGICAGKQVSQRPSSAAVQFGSANVPMRATHS